MKHLLRWEVGENVGSGEAYICLPNVPRQVSLAGGARGSQRMGVKALGMLFCQHPLCLSGGTSNWCSSKLPTGQRLTARACSQYCFRRSMRRGIPLAFLSASGGPWQSRCWESWKSYQAEALEYCFMLSSKLHIQALQMQISAPIIADRLRLSGQTRTKTRHD